MAFDLQPTSRVTSHCGAPIKGPQVQQPVGLCFVHCVFPRYYPASFIPSLKGGRSCRLRTFSLASRAARRLHREHNKHRACEHGRLTLQSVRDTLLISTSAPLGSFPPAHSFPLHHEPKKRDPAPRTRRSLVRTRILLLGHTQKRSMEGLATTYWTWRSFR